jgi:membrane protease YdiL (CAAX protease family)
VYIWQLKLFGLISFGLKYWYLFLPLILVVATAIMLLMYRGNKKDYELGRQQRISLMTLRFLSVALIAFLLLSPFIKNLKKMVRHPLIIAAWDNSGSVVSTADSVQLAEEIINPEEHTFKRTGK